MPAYVSLRERVYYRFKFFDIIPVDSFSNVSVMNFFSGEVSLGLSDFSICSVLYFDL